MAFWIPLLIGAAKAAAATGASMAVKKAMTPDTTMPMGDGLSRQDSGLTSGLIKQAQDQQGQQVQQMSPPQAPQLQQPQFLTVEDLLRRTQ